MTTPADVSNRSLRWGIYTLLIALAVGNMLGRLLAVNSVNRIDLESHLINRDLQAAESRLHKEGLTGTELEKKLGEAKEKITRRRRLQRPFLSANDRSRWLAIRALAEQRTYAIDELLDRNVWNTIDMVQHRGRDGKLHLYSSKPPLLITLLAGEYWLISKVPGMTLESDPYFVDRLMLIEVNIVPMAIMFWIVAWLAERFGTTDWGKIFVVASACFGTMLMPFAVVLNNHLLGAVSAACSMYFFVKIWCDGSVRRRDYAWCGLFAAFTFSCELPALAFLCLVGLALLFCDRRAWLVAFLPAVACVVVAALGTNYAAHGTFSPPYAHRSSTNPDDNWYHYTYTIDGVERESYWLDPQGLDRGEPSKAVYALNVLVGHHGIFSLTPIWLLSLLGIVLWMRAPDRSARWIAVGIAVLTIVCLIFFILLRPQQDRNYGGMTSGFRWMFWFAPLWLWAMLPVADKLAQSVIRQAFGLVLLALSVLSASYPTWNPWTQPWIYNAMDYLGWL